MFQFDNPVSVSICSDGKWRADTGEVSIENGGVYLTAKAASWVRIDWEADFSRNALVLGDAWERSYGTLGWRPIGEPAFHPWYFAVKDGENVQCFGMKTAPASICSWTLTPKSISLLMDVRCGCLDTLFDGRRVLLAQLLHLEGTENAHVLLQKFCGMMCDKPVLPKTPFYGGNDWYAASGVNTFESVLELSDILAECAEGLKNRPYQTIDAGWQLCHHWHLNEEYIGGPFRYPNDKFGDMKRMADAIKERDIHPGIWIRPLQTVEYLPEETYLRKKGKVKVIDPSHPYSKEKLAGDIRTLRQWGYDLIKFDFPTYDIFGKYGFSMNQSVVEGDWAFYERHKTSAEIILEYYKLTADAADGALINACNSLSHLSAGLFPIYRIGDDSSINKFETTLKMCVNTLAFRGVQHNHFYSADADCVSITGNGLWEGKNSEFLRLLSYSGTPVTVSIETAFYSKEIREAVSNAFALGSEPHEVARPLDWEENRIPRHWQTFDGEKTFNW